MSGHLTAEQITDFQENGYLIIPSLFDAEEAKILHTAAKADKAFAQHAHDLEDGEGGKAQLVLWNKCQSSHATIYRYDETVLAECDRGPQERPRTHSLRDARDDP